MAVLLTGAERDAYVAVLAEWNVGGDPAPVQLGKQAEKDRVACLPSLSPKQIKEQLYLYARDERNRISRVDETRAEYRHWKYHYDLWPTIEGEVYYFETCFREDPDEPVIYIMRFKPDRQRY